MKIKNSFIIGLAPMDGVTDEAYRQTQCQVYKPDVIFTEFTSAEGISRGGVKLYDELLYSANERPIIGQIFGKDPESFYKSAIILTHLGFDGIDINMGCPAKNVTQHGSGAALIGKPELASELIESVRRGIDDYCSGKVTINDIGLKKATLDVIKRNRKYSNIVETLQATSLPKNKPTLSLKTRLGIDSDVSDKWIPHVLKHKLDFMTLHGRTLRQGYSGTSNWESIARAAQIAKETNTPFWGNGDVTNIQQAQEYGQKYGVTGILIGRSSMGNPWIFTNHQPTWSEKFAIMKFHTQKFIEVYPERRLDPLRHHYILFVSGHPNAKELRQKVIRIESFEQLCSLEADFINC